MFVVLTDFLVITAVGNEAGQNCVLADAGGRLSPAEVVENCMELVLAEVVGEKEANPVEGGAGCGEDGGG